MIRRRIKDLVPEQAISGLCDVMADDGEQEIATAAKVQFDSYARRSDVLAFRGEDIIIPQANALGRYRHGAAVNFEPATSNRWRELVSERNERWLDCLHGNGWETESTKQ